MKIKNENRVKVNGEWGTIVSKTWSELLNQNIYLVCMDSGVRMKVTEGYLDDIRDDIEGKEDTEPEERIKNRLKEGRYITREELIRAGAKTTIEMFEFDDSMELGFLMFRDATYVSALCTKLFDK